LAGEICGKTGTNDQELTLVPVFGTYFSYLMFMELEVLAPKINMVESIRNESSDEHNFATHIKRNNNYHCPITRHYFSQIYATFWLEKNTVPISARSWYQKNLVPNLHTYTSNWRQKNGVDLWHLFPDVCHGL